MEAIVFGRKKKKLKLEHISTNSSNGTTTSNVVRTQDDMDVESIGKEVSALNQMGTTTTYMHPFHHSNESGYKNHSLNMLLCESDINKINVISEDHPNLNIEEDEDAEDDDVEMEFTMNPITQEKIGSNILETQYRSDHSFENECLKEMSLNDFKQANDYVKNKIENHTKEFNDFTNRAKTIYKVMFDMYGTKFESILNNNNNNNSNNNPPNSLKGKDTLEDVYNKLLNSNNVPILKRKDIILEFLRPPLRECGERACVNGHLCQSIQQFRQLWLKDPVLFETNWGITLDKQTGKILDSQKKEFDGFLLREFLSPEIESKRKSNWNAEIAKYINDMNHNHTKNTATATTTTITNNKPSRRHSEGNNTDLEGWLTEVLAKINPPLHGYCILCLLRLRSELTTTSSTASIISNPNVCALVQHHRNLFGIDGEYKPGTEIRRGSNICGLVGMALEYRVDNYLPGTNTIRYKFLKVNNNNNDSTITLSENTIQSLQWTESEAIVYNSSQELDKPKNSK